MTKVDYDKNYFNQVKQQFRKWKESSAKVGQQSEEHQIRKRADLLNTYNHIITFIGIIAGFGFTAIDKVENIYLFLLSEGFFVSLFIFSIFYLKQYGRGNDLLSRLQKEQNIDLIFPDGTKTLLRAIKNVSLDEYRNRMIFSVGGRPVTRLDLIRMVADEKGAHTDDIVDQMHAISQRVILPLGNPARDKLFFNQNTMYLLSIAKTVVNVVEKQLIR